MSDTALRRRIRAQTSPRDPATMRFILDAPVQAGRSASFDGPVDGAPLARALFCIAGVSRVQVRDETILVTRAPDADWQALKAPIAAAIRQVLDRTDRPLGEVPDPAAVEGSDGALLAAVAEFLDRRVNPSIAGHGGHIAAEAVEGGVVRVRMAGGCQGCAASSLTLRNGVETMLRAAFPAIREIVDVTNHAVGKKPFYSRMPGHSPVLPGGTAQEAQPATAIDPLPLRVRRHLEGLPAETLPMTYGRLARDLGMAAPGAIRRITEALEATMREDAAADRPFLAARVVGRGPLKLPGRGFFDLARELGHGPRPGETEEAFHRRHMAKHPGAAL